MRVALSLLGGLAVTAAACSSDPEPIVPPSLALTTTSLADGRLGMPYDATLAASGGKTPYVFSVVEGELPAGLAIAASKLSGTPTVPGRASFTLQVKDAAGAVAAKALTLYVTPDALAVTTSSLASGTESQRYGAALSGMGGIAPYRWSVSAGALPAGLSLSTDGMITGTASAAGAAAFTVQLADAEDKTVTRDLMLTIRPLLPMITTSTLPRALRNDPYDVQLEAASGHDPYTWSLAMGMLPRGISLNAMGHLAGRPTVSGVYRFVVRVTDARGRVDEAELGLAVLAPLAITTRTLPHAILGRPYDVQLEASGGVRPYVWQVNGALPAGIMVDATGHFTGQTTQAGDYPLSVRLADDAGGLRTAMYTLTVDDVATYSAQPMLAFPPVCSVPGNPQRCVPWTQNGMVCTSTHVSYQTVEITVNESFAIASLSMDIDVDYSDSGVSYNTGNAINNRNMRLRALITAPDGRVATLCGNDNGNRQMTGCYGDQRNPQGSNGLHGTYPMADAPTSTPFSVFNGMNARGVWRFQTSVAWPTVDGQGNCQQAGTINSVTLNFRADRSADPYITLSGFTYNNLITDPWVRISGGNQVPDNNSIQLVATYWDVGPNGFREGGQGDDVPSSAPFTFTGMGLPAGTTVTPSGFVTGGPDTGTAQLQIDDGQGHTLTRRLLVTPPDWNLKTRDF